MGRHKILARDNMFNHSIKAFFLSVLGIGNIGHAELGLIGGTSSTANAYSAYVDVPSGNLTLIGGLPPNSTISSVSLNTSGKGIIAGQNNGDGYAAFVSPNGSLIPLSFSLPFGGIASASINEAGNALMGGTTSFTPYAASITPDGTVTPITLSVNSGFILGADLNDEGLGLIGGEGNLINSFSAYAAYISPTGLETVLDLPQDSGSIIRSVAINCLGNGIVGGTVFPGAYGAFTTAGQSFVIPLSMDNVSTLQSVAINDAGLGLIGGLDNSGNAYAAYAVSNGTVSPLFTTPFPGVINSVAINSSGKGMIGGVMNSNVYAAFVDPNGVVNSLIFSPPLGTINSVAINDMGIGIFGGQVGSQGYAALVAPNGALTFLDVAAQGSINSVALEAILNTVIDEITPKSIGFWNSAFYTQLAASSALEWRFIEQNKIWQQSCQDKVTRCDESSPCQSSTKNSIWIAPFGDFFRQKKQGSIPSIQNNVGGVLLAYDRQGSNFLVGGALGYANNSLHYGNHLGHGKIQEEMASVYGSYYVDHFWFDAALWGGVYQFSNVRHANSRSTVSKGACTLFSNKGPSLTSKGKTHGWILSPHFEMATPWSLDRNHLYFVEPFAMFDWIYCWQDSFKERGPSGFNLKMKDLHGSLLQSEVGVRFYEKFAYCWGDFLLEEKISYINQAPFFDKNVRTSFVGSTASFPIAVGSTKVENLASFELMAAFAPVNKSYPFGGLSFQTNANASYQSYFITAFAGWDY